MSYTGPLDFAARKPVLPPDCFTRAIPRTEGQRRFDAIMLETTMNIQRRENLRCEWALRQVFQECLTHCWEAVQLVRYDNSRDVGSWMQ